MDMLFEPWPVDMTVVYQGKFYLRKVAYWDVSTLPQRAVPELGSHERVEWDVLGQCYVIAEPHR